MGTNPDEFLHLLRTDDDWAGLEYQAPWSARLLIERLRSLDRQMINLTRSINLLTGHKLLMGTPALIETRLAVYAQWVDDYYQMAQIPKFHSFIYRLLNTLREA